MKTDKTVKSTQALQSKKILHKIDEDAILSFCFQINGFYQISNKLKNIIFLKKANKRTYQFPNLSDILL